MGTDRSKLALAIVVLLHLAVTLVHGAAHVGAAVALGPAALAFVVGVIEIGPLAGLAVARLRPAAGALIVAATMAGALLFGLLNHFVLHGADHVSQVAVPFRAVFTSTAALLALTETAGVVIGIWRGARAFGRVS